MIWRRHVEHAPDPLRRAYFKLQADRMYRYERRVSQDVRPHRRSFPNRRRRDAPPVRRHPRHRNPHRRQHRLLPALPTPPPAATADLVFVGSMDWLPNVDGVLYFVREILPLIRKHRPATTLAIVGRTPPPKITQLAAEDPRHPGHRHRRPTSVPTSGVPPSPSCPCASAAAPA